MKNSVGLSDYLVTNLEYTKMIQPLPIKNLFFIPPGQTAYNTGDLFSERKVKNLLDHLYGHFEYIIFDSPPFSIIPESIIIAEQCHSNIFVVRHNYSPKNVIKSLEEVRMNGRLQNMHLLVNGIKTMKGFGLKYYYGYDSSYGFGYYNNYYNHKRNLKKMPEHARVSDGAPQGR
jgi:Mrp family chromosome partitioning ATPase